MIEKNKPIIQVSLLLVIKTSRTQNQYFPDVDSKRQVFEELIKLEIIDDYENPSFTCKFLQN